MDASLDTDIVIHLYKSNKQELIFSSFNKLYMYDFLFENELRKRAYNIYERVKIDVTLEKIKIITNRDLINMGIKGLFEEYKDTNKYLFDQGELHAIALAKAMGIAAFVSDDTKDQGPHQTLVKELISDVIPFAFYELLFLKYLNSELTVDEFYLSFQEVNNNSMKERPMNFKWKITETVKRFSNKYGTERDKTWILDYCKPNRINLKCKMKELKELLKSI